MDAYEVVEFFHDDPDTVRVVRSFTDEVDAVAFSLRHYETQIGTHDSCTDPACACGADACECEECANGWRVTNWKSFSVEVWGAN